MSDKTVEIRVSISTDGRVQGRYNVQVWETTSGRQRQMLNQTTDKPGPLVTQLSTAAFRSGVWAEVVDETGGL